MVRHFFLPILSSFFSRRRRRFDCSGSDTEEEERNDDKEDNVATARKATTSGGQNNQRDSDGDGDSREATGTSGGNRRRLVSTKDPDEHPYGTDDEEENNDDDKEVDDDDDDDDDDKKEDDDKKKGKRNSSSCRVAETTLNGGKRMSNQITLSKKEAKKARRKDRKHAAIASSSRLGARPPETSVTNPKHGAEDNTNQGNGYLRTLEDAAFQQAIETGVRSIDRQAAKLLTGITISSSKTNTCMPDALETIISSLMNKHKELEPIPLPNGRFVERSDLGSFLRETLCPTEQSLPSQVQMEAFLQQNGFTVKQQHGEFKQSKIRLLTQKEGSYIIFCSFPELSGSPQHCISYLVESDCRLLIDNFPYQKPIQIRDAAINALTNDVTELSRRLNHDIHRKIANEIFKRCLGKHTNKIHSWYEISWTNKKQDGQN